MFENIRKCLDDCEKASEKQTQQGYLDKAEDINILEYFELDMSKALMKDLGAYNFDEKIAKIILAAKGLSNEVKVKVE